MNTTEEITSLMFEVGRLLRDRALADGSSVSYLHLATLRYIDDNKKPLMREIATYLRVAPPSATSLINTLVKQGDIRRVSDDKDRRAVRLEITTQGLKSLSDGTRRKHDLMRSLIQELSDRERSDLKNILDKITRSAAQKDDQK